MKFFLDFFKKKQPTPKPKKTKAILAGRKYKDDTVFCFLNEQKKYGVSILAADGNYEELIPPIYDSTHYHSQRDVIFATLYNEGKHTIGRNSTLIFDLTGTLLAEFNDIDSISDYGKALKSL